MTLRTRLFVQDLEARENPSGPSPLDPYGSDTTPAKTDTTTDSGNFLVSIITAVTTAVSTTTTTTTSDVNSIYKISLIP